MKKINWLSILSKACTVILLCIASLVFFIGLLIIYASYREFFAALLLIASGVAIVKGSIESYLLHKKELEEKERLKEMYETIQQMVGEKAKKTEEKEGFKLIDYK